MNDAICVCCNEPCEESELNGEGECSDCAPIEEEDDDSCSSCNGTGEGQVDGAVCSACGGKGRVEHKPEQDEPEPDDYDPREDERDYGPWGYEGP